MRSPIARRDSAHVSKDAVIHMTIRKQKKDPFTREELIRRCSERIELTLDHPKQAIPVMDSMGFTNYQVTDKSHIHIFERLNESANVNMELAKAGILVNGISITSEELETYFLNLTGGNQNA